MENGGVVQVTQGMSPEGNLWIWKGQSIINDHVSYLFLIQYFGKLN